MTPTECPRCEAERRGLRVRVAANVAAALALVFGGFSCCTLTYVAGIHSGEANGHIDPWALPQGLCEFAAALGLGTVAAGLYALWRRYHRVAATPLTAPSPGLLASYREGLPSACPRHPWGMEGDAPAEPSGPQSPGFAARAQELWTSFWKSAARGFSALAAAVTIVASILVLIVILTLLLVVLLCIGMPPALH